MKKTDVIIGSEVYTRSSDGRKVKVKVLRPGQKFSIGRLRKSKTVFVCLNLATKREIERGPGALHFTLDFDRSADEAFLRRKVKSVGRPTIPGYVEHAQRTEISSLSIIPDHPTYHEDLSGDPGHDMAERRNVPPAPDTIPDEEDNRDTLPDTIDYSDPAYYQSSDNR